MADQKKKILLIDDDAYIRDVYEEILQEAGLDVTTAIDGEEAVQKASEGGFDLILLDVMMPKLDGLGVLKALKQSPPKKPNKTIILLTNLAHDKIISEGIALGAKSYLIKSEMNPDELVVQIRKFLV